MDPNATFDEIKDLQADLRHSRANGLSRKYIRNVEADIVERLADLREWKRKGGFAPRGGWPRGV